MDNISIIVNLLASFATLAMAIATFRGLSQAKKQIALSAQQMKLTAGISSGEFLIKFKTYFNDERKTRVYAKLVNGEPFIDEDWLVIGDYMGMFSIMNLMIDKGAFQLDDCKAMFTLRLRLLVDNQEILYRKLIRDYEWWEQFYHLLARILDPWWCDTLYHKLKTDENFREMLRKRGTEVSVAMLKELCCQE